MLSRPGTTVSGCDGVRSTGVRVLTRPCVSNADRDSPNQLPVFDMLQVGAFSELVNNGAIKQSYYDSLEWLISLGLSVEGEDVAG